MTITTPEPPGAGATRCRPEPLCEAFQITAADAPDDVALRTLGGEVTHHLGASTPSGARDRRRPRGARASSAATRSRCMLTNRPEFHLVDTAAMHLGATPFSIYNTSAPSRSPTCSATPARASWSPSGSSSTASWQSGADARAHRRGRRRGRRRDTSTSSTRAATRPSTSRPRGARSQPDDVLTLIYTSGTTGPPKGVELTHANLMSMLRAIAQVIEPRHGGAASSRSCRTPHIADRGVLHYASMVDRLHGHRLPRPEAADARTARRAARRVWGGVPRIWEKLKAALEAGFAAEQDEAKKRGASRRRSTIGRQKVRLEQAGEPVPDELRQQWDAMHDELVFSKIRASLGLDRVRVTSSARRRRRPRSLEFFAALGLPICEVWGMSETSGDRDDEPARRASASAPSGRRSPGVEIKLADDGEILVRGPDRHARLPQPAREDARDVRPTTAGCTPATSASSTTTAT